MNIDELLNEKTRLKTAIAWIDLYIQAKTAAADTTNPEMNATFERKAAEYLFNYQQLMKGDKTDENPKFPYLWTKN